MPSLLFTEHHGKGQDMATYFLLTTSTKNGIISIILWSIGKSMMVRGRYSPLTRRKRISRLHTKFKLAYANSKKKSIQNLNVSLFQKHFTSYVEPYIIWIITRTRLTSPTVNTTLTNSSSVFPFEKNQSSGEKTSRTQEIYTHLVSESVVELTESGTIVYD